MGTKTHPGKFDCYSKAGPNEPMFILLARDPAAAHLVTLWAAVRGGDADAIDSLTDDLLEIAKRVKPISDEKLIEATHCALAMEAYRSGAPYCHVCLCTEEHACTGGCEWANANKTICTACVTIAAAHEGA